MLLRNFFRLIVVFIFLHNSSFAQASATTDTSKDFIFGGHVFFSLDFPITDLGTTNNELGNAGLPDANYPKCVLGVGIQYQVGRAILNIYYNRLRRKTNTDSTTTTNEYKSFGFNIGYDLFKHPYTTLEPYIGFRVSGINYLYRQIAPTSSGFGNYLQSNLQYKEMNNQLAHLDLGVSFSRQQSIMLGVRAGYLLPLDRSRWTVDDNDNKSGGQALAGSPAVRHQAYITIMIGVGTISSDKLERQRNRRPFNDNFL